MHNYRVWTGWIVALMLASTSSASAQQTPSQHAPSAPSAPAAPGVAAQPQQPAQPQQAYPAQPQQAYPAQPQAYPTQGGYPAAQGYPPPQQGYPPPQQGYAPPQQPYYQQPYVTTGTAPRPRRPSRALLITGASIFGGAYLISALVGAAIVDEDDYDDDGYSSCRNCDSIGGWLFLPVAGPWVAMKDTDNDGGLAFLGMLQLVGAGLTIGGIVRFVNTKRQYEAGLASWDFERGRQLTLDVSSTPVLTGPRMKLQF
jgi:hypothetical protein